MPEMGYTGKKGTDGRKDCAGKDGRLMKLCINEMAMSSGGDILSHIKDVSAQDIRFMEISKACLANHLRSGGTLEEVRAALEEGRITPVCLNSIESISFNPKRGMRVLREMSEYLFYCCREIGCGCVEVIGSFKVPSQDPQEVENETAEAMAVLADAAKPFGIRLALEYMAVPGSSVQTFSRALSIVRKAGRENAGILVDSWHHCAGGSSPEELLGAKKEEIFMVHVSDCPACEPGTAVRTDSFLPGEGSAPIGQMLANLLSIGYEGPVSAEIMAPAIRALPPREYIARSKAAMLPLL